MREAVLRAPGYIGVRSEARFGAFSPEDPNARFRREVSLGRDLLAAVVAAPRANCSDGGCADSDSDIHHESVAKDAVDTPGPEAVLGSAEIFASVDSQKRAAA